MSAVLVVGGGLLGAAIARHAARQGDQVVVASPTERSHPGLWRRFDLQVDRAAALPGADRAWICARGPTIGAITGLAADLDRRGVEVTVCLPLGAVASPQGTLLSFGPLFGLGDAWLAPLLPALRGGGHARHPRDIPPSRPLLVDDAARAALRLAGAGGAHPLVGATRLEMADIARLLTARFPARCTARWLGGLTPSDREVFRLSGEAPGAWDEDRLGARTPLAEWIDRLPGPRAKR